MKRILFSILIFPALLSARTLNIVINSPSQTPAESPIYLTGDIPGLCFWQPACLKMTDIGFGSFSLHLSVPDDLKILQYKITRGGYETEAADSFSIAYKNFVVDLEKTKTPIVQNIVHWKDLSPLKKSLNVVGPFFLYSSELGVTKEISVFLPASYYTSQNSFPVIYMHDGQNIFDPTTSSFGVEWSIDETMNELSEKKLIKEAIVVGIHTNNVDREYEYDYFLKGKKYSDFVANSVIPFTEQNFRVIKKRESRFLMGSSMGALISLMMIIDRPDLFKKGAGLSFPAFINDKAIFRFMNSKKALPFFDFYMDHGDQGSDARYAPSAMELYSLLIKHGVGVQYQVFPFASHTEADWARRASVPLSYLLKK